VKPTITDPWETLINRAKSLADLEKLHERMQHYRVLDPACGSGNFLYLAYRELKRLEKKLFERMDELAPSGKKKARRISFVTARQFYGMDIIPFAVELAKVTMMIARKLSIEELHMEEPALPFDDLDDNFIAGDSLINHPENGAEPFKTPWPEADVIIGNPPFLGAKRLKPERGPEYVNAVRKLFPEVPGMADYCVYWFRRAHEHLPVCTPDDPVAGRAGLVGTQNVRNNKSREGGLDYVVQSGTIVEAVDNQPWSGEANVHVSIANWVKHTNINQNLTAREQGVVREQLLIPEKRKLWFKVDPDSTPFKLRNRPSGPKHKFYEVAYRDSSEISASLSDETSVTGAKVLSANQSVCYTGQYPRYEGFMLDAAQAKRLLTDEKRNHEVIYPFIVGAEVLTQDHPDRYVVDFQKRDILEAKSYKAPFKLLEEKVLPYVRQKAQQERDKTGIETGQDQNWLKVWWQHFRPRQELIEKLDRLNRFVVCSRVTKRPVFVFLSTEIRPGDALSCFTLDDDYSFGILQSDTHWQWFVAKCSKLKSDFRYTPESVFDTFPWPQSPTAKDIKAVAEAGREVRRIRDAALTKIKGGLRAVYRTLELPGQNQLKDVHVALDAAVLAAYGFSPKKDLLQQLLDLNLEVSARIDAGETVTAPGIPPDYPTPKSLITPDCIRPPK
jgi:hypothetical protein